MGLPGSGKTTLAIALKESLTSLNKSVDWFNADEVRKQYNDWDFSSEGRIRQATRLAQLASTSTKDYVIVDFVAGLKEQREAFNADVVVWCDTIKFGRYQDTNEAFTQPLHYCVKVTSKDAETWAKMIMESIKHE